MAKPATRVNVYFDGFNFYYGLKSKSGKQFYWLDFTAFSEKFLRPYQTLVSANYFSAVPHDTGKADRQDLLFSANKLNPKFNLFLGKYMKKHITCLHSMLPPAMALPNGYICKKPEHWAWN